MKPWKTLTRRTILDHGKYLRVERHAVGLPDGRVLDDWPWVELPDYVCILPVMPDGRVLCFRQTKYAIKGLLLMPAGGYIEPGEKPLTAARRELLEETGGRAARWTRLGAYRVDSNRGAGTAHLYLAEGVRRVAEPDSDDLEEQEVVLLTPRQLGRAMARGEFRALAAAALVALALPRLDRKDAVRIGTS
jgi:ADP-ribose pyrophosphatase